MPPARPVTSDRLLRAGLGVIHAQGYAAAGVQEITAAAGVPKGSFYNHFPSKAAFGLAVLDAYWKAAEPALALLAEPGREAPERLERHFRAIQAGMRVAGQERGCLIGNFAVEAPAAGPEIRDRVAALLAEWTAAVAACLRAGADAGAIRTDVSPEDLAQLLVAAWQGAVQRAKVEPSAAAFDAFHRAVGRLVRP